MLDGEPTNDQIRAWLGQQLQLEEEKLAQIEDKLLQIVSLHLHQWKRTLEHVWLADENPHELGVLLGPIDGKDRWLMTGIRPTRVKVIALGTLSPNEKQFNPSATVKSSDEE